MKNSAAYFAFEHFRHSIIVQHEVCSYKKTEVYSMTLCMYDFYFFRCERAFHHSKETLLVYECFLFSNFVFTNSLLIFARCSHIFANALGLITFMLENRTPETNLIHAKETHERAKRSEWTKKWELYWSDNWVLFKNLITSDVEHVTIFFCISYQHFVLRELVPFERSKNMLFVAIMKNARKSHFHLSM